MNLSITKRLTELTFAPAIFEKLFDHVPDIVFFVKDVEGKYLVVNQTLVERCMAKNKKQILGLTSTEVLGEELGMRYMDQDRKVINTRQPLIQHLELHNYESVELGWCLTTKIPLLDEIGVCNGLIGVSQDLKLAETKKEMFANINSATQYIEKNIENNPSITEMAKVANMSHYQLDRRMKMVFGLSAGKWLIKTRITQASQMLTGSSLSVLEIALAVGYADQSAFTKQFKKVTGLSPLRFKKINQKHN